ncbi:helix-turn-helix domain-containing protein [Nocardia sp. NPDC024068]|uniref:helix-turn-helix domain-containing protein n=1 Tax=Nocardia sp. NPDC024068 TaxID=3157197 RepID=UPI0033EDB6E4
MADRAVDRPDGGRSASPPTARVLDVLDYLVLHRGEPLGLSELARRCEISKPTCLGILTELTTRDYLRCDPGTKTYRLGPALVTAGRAAQRDFAVEPVVSERLTLLARRFGVMCVASGRVGDEFMVLEVATPPGVRAPVGVGQVFPFALPTALMYALWQSDDELEQQVHDGHAWLAGIELGELRRMAVECRTTGYLVENLTPQLERVYRLLGGSAAREVSPELRALITELLAGMGGRRLLLRDELRKSGSDTTHRVGVIAAPTFGADGDQSLLLALNFQADLTVSEIAERGSVLKAAAAELTAELGGHNPHTGSPDG